MRKVDASSLAGMHVVMVGASHKAASVEVRERLHVGLQLLREIAPRLAGENGEAVVVSTCNRTEIYLAAADVAGATALAFDELIRLTGLGSRGLRSVLSVLNDGEAAAHLFAVAGGLESMVVGETQILGQVREAHRGALEARASGPVLDRLFRQAVQTGRRIRSETMLLDWPASVPSATTRLAESLLGSLESVTALVIGAGKTSELVLLNLVHRRCRRIVVANRTLTRARELAARFRAELVPLERVEGALLEADLVISCTASTGTVLCAADIGRIAAKRQGRPLLLLDIAVPRDLDPEIAGLRGCYLYNVDDLADVVDANRVGRSRELARARAITREESDKFRDWQLSLGVLPAIAALRRSADEIRAGELRRVEGKLGRLPPRERQLVEALTAQIMNKFLHEPTMRMKHAAAGPAGPAYAGAVQHLFGPVDEPR
ncbi:MAG TPA: glutamyl-tRNA reductase [Gaiellaceae bacterium]|nr:glutamyl-tRNA reductase [Gaiellaceae bacterium]